MKSIKLLYILLIALLLTSCDNGQIKKSLLPGVSGKAGEVLIIMNKQAWQGTCGESMRNVFLQDVQVLPQSEPMLNPINISNKAFSELFRIHRNIIYTQISKDIKKAKITIEKDKWAQPQIVINIVAPTKKEFIELFNAKKNKILNIILKKERDRLTNNYKKYSEQDVIKKIKNKAKINLIVPKGYTYDLDTNNFIWISHETPQISQGIFIYWYQYTDTAMFSKNNLTNKRNEILKKYVPGPRKGSYMTTETQISPVINTFMLKNNYFAELRGLWKVEGDYMGGSFVSISSIDKQNNRIVTIDGYVYAPKYDKRNYMRQIEAILYSLSF